MSIHHFLIYYISKTLHNQTHEKLVNISLILRLPNPGFVFLHLINVSWENNPNLLTFGISKVHIHPLYWGRIKKKVQNGPPIIPLCKLTAGCQQSP